MSEQVEMDWRLSAVVQRVLVLGDTVIRVGEAMPNLLKELAGCVGGDGSVRSLDAHEAVDEHIDLRLRPTLVVADGHGREAEILRNACATLLRWRPVAIIAIDPDAVLDQNSTLLEVLHALRRPGYAVRRIGRFGLRRIDTSIYADRCIWVAIPCERKAQLERISSGIFWACLSPPWPVFSIPTRAA